MSDINQRPERGLAAVGADEPDGDELELLKRRAWAVLAWLGAVTLACGVGIAIVLRPEDEMTAQRLSVLSLLAGALGSSVAALASAADRIGRGWELESGERVPDDDDGTPERFVRRLVPLYVVRPLIGAGAGVLAYAALVGGLLFASRSGDEQPRTESVLFFAILGGLFATTLIERLIDTFDHFVGRD